MPEHGRRWVGRGLLLEFSAAWLACAAGLHAGSTTLVFSLVLRGFSELAASIIPSF